MHFLGLSATTAVNPTTDVQKYIADDKIHLSADGIALAADMVEAVIRREAEKLDSSSNNAGASEKTSDGAPV